MTHAYIDSIEDTVIVLRQTLALQGELDIIDVINSDSIRGAELTKLVDGKLVPYAAKDTVIIFELVESPDVDLSLQNEDDSMLDISAHTLKLVIYGDSSRTVARKLKSRMWSQKVVNVLAQKGISVSSISDVVSTTEIVNTVRYLRRDLQITFVIAMKVDAIDGYSEILTATTSIKKNE